MNMTHVQQVVLFALIVPIAVGGWGMGFMLGEIWKLRRTRGSLIAVVFLAFVVACTTASMMAIVLDPDGLKLVRLSYSWHDWFPWFSSGASDEWTVATILWAVTAISVVAGLLFTGKTHKARPA